MTPDSNASPAFEFVLQVERVYAALMHSAPSDAEPGLGGRLLYAGNLDDEGRALLVAGNIAGAASLAATADAAAQKQAIRDGVADFLVNSLDEALRILKNEIRKRETVAVCIAGAADAVEHAMRERGVTPDLLPRNWPSAGQSERTVLSWRAASAPALWLPKLDAIALDCLAARQDSEAATARRWLRFAPRYLGRMAQGLRTMHCGPDVAREFIARAEAAVRCGEIGVEVEIGLNNGDPVLRLVPQQA